MTDAHAPRLALAALLQGLYWSISGVWPLVHMPSFVAVTGPKVDLWLVRTVSLLIVVIGVVLLLSVKRRRVTPEVACLAIGAALSLMAIDLYYTSVGVIAKVYLLDALGEALLIAIWAWAFVTSRRPGDRAPQA